MNIFRPTFQAIFLKTALRPTQDEVLRRVGRNLRLFQQIEGLFKFLLSCHRAGGTPADFKEQLQMPVDTVNRTMLGHLVDKYGIEVLKDAGVKVPEEESPPDPFTFSFQISGNTEFVQAMHRDMKLMTEQRNELVHGFLPRWEPDLPESFEETLAYLDTQHEKVLPMHEHLRTTASHLHQTQRNFSSS